VSGYTTSESLSSSHVGFVSVNLARSAREHLEITPWNKLFESGRACHKNELNLPDRKLLTSQFLHFGTIPQPSQRILRVLFQLPPPLNQHETLEVELDEKVHGSAGWSVNQEVSSKGCENLTKQTTECHRKCAEIAVKLELALTSLKTTSGKLARVGLQVAGTK
jgi:hypothetical protein